MIIIPFLCGAQQLYFNGSFPKCKLRLSTSRMDHSRMGNISSLSVSHSDVVSVTDTTDRTWEPQTPLLL